MDDMQTPIPNSAETYANSISKPLTETQFSPLPYKTEVTNPSSSNLTNDYMIRFAEHLLLTSCKPPPPTNIISSIIQ